MQPKSFKPALAFGNPYLPLWLSKLDQQRALLVQVKTILSEPLADHVLHSQISGDQLLLYCDSAAWVSQIRFYQPTILKELQQKGYPRVADMRCKVLQPVESLRLSRRVQVPQPGIVTAIDQQAARFAAGDELGSALLRLGAALRRRQPVD